MSIKMTVYKIPREGVDRTIIGSTVVGDAQVERLNRFPNILLPTNNTPDDVDKMGGGTSHLCRNGEAFSGSVSSFSLQKWDRLGSQLYHRWMSPWRFYTYAQSVQARVDSFSHLP